MKESDSGLVSRSLAGDLDAYAELMARYRGDLGRYAFHMLGSRDDAEDALQDAFIRAYNALASCEQPDRFGAWLFRILVNRCHTAQDRIRRRAELLTSQDPADVAERGDAVDSFAWREEINRALGELRTDQREAFLLKHVQGLSYDEMARLTGVGESALRMRVKRASDHLRELLRDVYAG